MPLPSRRFGFDEELGKRDDDHKYHPKSGLQPTWQSWIATPRLRRRRTLFVVTLTILVFCLLRRAFKSRELNHDDLFSKSSFTFSNLLPPGSGSLFSGKPPGKNEDSKACLRYYNGPVEFHRLAITLHGASRTMGHLTEKSNVLFVAGNLKSIAMLVPLACEMARWRRNKVHFVLMGREDALMKDILEVNAVTPQCDVMWHDARPNHARYSSDARLVRGVTSAWHHIQTFIHPQVVMLDSTEQEDSILVKTLQEKNQDLQIPIIGLPQDALENMMWITPLDCGSLKAWNKVDIDILIHASETSSGGLIRLLKSLERASYPSSSAPRITVELPPVIDPPTRNFLREFRAGQEKRNQIILRHHIRPGSRSEEDNSIRFLESFFPTNPSDSHVLILSTQAELSPLFYHYLKYALLEYKYSSYGTENRDRLLGISLELPYKDIGVIAQHHKMDGVNSTFLWQEPNNKAALYFGDKWVEIHDFVRRRLDAQESRKAPSVRKVFSKEQPYWMELMMELCRLRRYYMLYPHFDPENALVTIHHELSQTPEDYTDKVTSDSLARGNTTDLESGTYLGASDKSESSLTSQRSLLSLIPPDGDFPVLEDMPVLLHDGQRTLLRSRDSPWAFSFRREVGGCGERKSKKRKELSTADLFCLDGDDGDDDDDDEDEDETLETRKESNDLLLQM
ncbi:MAG: hypothetical protein M1816_005732 [Peltula sp. TS41687]|nr:MAG: hypothetical protein M1816_005732 [Peltula sp. TS41687]